LNKVRSTFKIPVLTDIHESKDAKIAAEFVDIIQIPAFLIRQTEIIISAAKTGKIINLKKGQFMSPDSMKHAVEKITKSGNNNVMITDRGTMFGYQDMVVDFRGIPTMQDIATTVLDVTHSLQKPNQLSGVTGGSPKMIETIARAGVVNNVDGIFIETHFNPGNAKSDGENMLNLSNLEKLLTNLLEIRKTVNNLD
jgi:2-dehydro-3-deoxyphosphooctonate aldolase (KDO 8-P synthase)